MGTPAEKTLTKFKQSRDMSFYFPFNMPGFSPQGLTESSPGPALSLCCPCALVSSCKPASSASGTAVPLPGTGLVRGRGLVDEQRARKVVRRRKAHTRRPSGCGSFG